MGQRGLDFGEQRVFIGLVERGTNIKKKDMTMLAYFSLANVTC